MSRLRFEAREYAMVGTVIVIEEYLHRSVNKHPLSGVNKKLNRLIGRLLCAHTSDYSEQPSPDFTFRLGWSRRRTGILYRSIPKSSNPNAFLVHHRRKSLSLYGLPDLPC